MGRFHIPKLFFVVLFLLETSRFCLCKNTSFDCFERERQALSNLKKSFIENPLHILSSWEGTDCCKWKGVSCSTSNGHVVKLDLQTYLPTYKTRLVARDMNASLLELKYLIHLDLSGNDFQGSAIPEFFGLMKQLEYLNLNSANITGIVPHQLGNLTNLQHLDLSLNSFSQCPLPIFLKNMTSLRVLDLSSNSFNSSIPLWLSNLKNLVQLDLAYNQFNGVEGGLSMMLYNHCHLKSLNLSDNMLEKESLDTTRYVSGCIGHDLEELELNNMGLTGHFPDWLGQFKRLKVLVFSFNSFNGSVPTSIGRLSNLNALVLSSNQLSGVIPATIWNLSALEVLRLSSNSFNGTIPASIGRLSNLTILDLSSNQLSGVIPESLGQLSNLWSIDLGSNSWEGALSEIHFSNLSKLKVFDISSTHLSFNVKPEWVPPFQLSYIDMSSCKLRAPIPQWLETQKEVDLLYLVNTSISGPLPNSLWSMQFHSLDLSKNRITGSLPRNIADMFPTLLYFSVADNLINGTIPISFCKIDTLISLDLSNNMLSGEIPNCWNSSNQLNALKLSSNELTGVIPNSIGHLIELEWLHLKNNSLGGEVPLPLRNCRSLKLLNLDENRFSGNIPTWIGQSLLSLQILRLRKNMFNGYIPRQLCQLTTLKILDLAVNNISGTIPQCFGNFSGMVLQQTTDIAYQEFNKNWDEVIVKGINIKHTNSIETILEVRMDLSDNNLIGMIPEGLTILSGLICLNLSHNHLTGNIPKGIGNLTSLISLDFSRNQLSGNIPTNMSVLTSLSHLNLSYNNFLGKIPTGPQLQTLLDPSIYAGNLELCGAPLPERCPGDEPSQAPIPDRDEENDEEDKSEKVWFYTFPVLGYITGLWGVLGVLLFKKSWRYAYFQLADNVIDWIYVRVAIKTAWLKKKMAKNHASN